MFWYSLIDVEWNEFLPIGIYLSFLLLASWGLFKNPLFPIMDLINRIIKIFKKERKDV